MIFHVITYEPMLNAMRKVYFSGQELLSSFE
jgi:hypothetical protein